jgi:hypothetical protein
MYVHRTLGGDPTDIVHWLATTDLGFASSPPTRLRLRSADRERTIAAVEACLRQNALVEYVELICPEESVRAWQPPSVDAATTGTTAVFPSVSVVFVSYGPSLIPCNGYEWMWRGLRALFPNARLTARIEFMHVKFEPPLCVPEAWPDHVHQLSLFDPDAALLTQGEPAVRSYLSRVDCIRLDATDTTDKCIEILKYAPPRTGILLDAGNLVDSAIRLADALRERVTDLRAHIQFISHWCGKLPDMRHFVSVRTFTVSIIWILDAGVRHELGTEEIELLRKRLYRTCQCATYWTTTDEVGGEMRMVWDRAAAPPQLDEIVCLLARAIAPKSNRRTADM